MTHTATRKPERLLGLYVAAFVDTLGVFLVLALLPYYAERFGASPTQIGALVSAFAVAQMISAPLWGRLSDRLGRRPVILAGLVISGFAYLVFAWADSLWLLFASRIAQGIGGGTVAAVFAYIADAVQPEDRAERIGWLTAATSGAALIGPAIGSIAGSVSPALPGLVAAVLCGVALMLCRVMLKNSGAVETNEEPSSLVDALLGVAKAPWAPAHRLIWIYTLGMFGNTALTAVAALALDLRFGVGLEDIWIFFAALAGGALVVRLTLLGVTVRSLGEAKTLRLGAVFLTLGLALFPLVPSLPWVLATVVLMALGTSFLFPCTTALITRAKDDGGSSGQLLGVQQAYGGASRIAGPILAGLAFERAGAGAPFYMGAAVLALAVLASFSVRQPAA